MATRVQALEEELIERVCARARERLDGDRPPHLEEFLRQYYRWVPPEDLVERDPLDVYGAALAHWHFAERRAPGTTKLRVYNPQFDRHGWQSTHTVVEVVTDDMPFLVDSVTMALTRENFGVHLVIHPVIRVERDDEDRLTDCLPAGGDAGLAESFLHVEIDRETTPEELESLHAELLRVLADVRAAVEDWATMRERLRAEIAALEAAPPPSVPAEEVEESRALLAWLDTGRFTFLGYREYDLVEDELRAVPGSGLGILRQRQDGARHVTKLSPRIAALAHAPRVLTLAKANSRSTVHRPAQLDYVGVKRFDEDGEVTGEARFLGLYTTRAYDASARETPFVRRKVESVLARAAFPPAGHNEKALLAILESLPRDELLQISIDELFDLAVGILALGERQGIRLFVRADDYERYLSCLLFLPRDRYNTQNRERIQAILREAFDAESVDWTVRLSESVLVRLHLIARVTPGALPEVDVPALEAQIVEATHAWSDGLRDSLLDEEGEETGNAWLRRYADAFPPGYRHDWHARSAVADVRRMEGLGPDGLGISLYRPIEAPSGTLRGKLYTAGEPVSLSAILPVFENMGLQVADERPYEIRPRDRERIWIHDFGLEVAGGGELDLDRLHDLFEDAFARVWHGDVENDGFNALVLRAGLGWREILVLRAVARYLRQARTTFSDRYMEQALAAHPELARGLVALFAARFAHAADRDAAEAAAAELEAGIDAVESLDEDRILRNFLAVISAILRTNHYQDSKPYLSFKLDPSRIPLVPEPRPRFEIFVYSPRVEGVHLRGGGVARGGLRWSDRREDFRTEVLGLMKAQMVKNALIVPVGAKGGFVVKRPPADRDALRDEVVACYRTFISGLLDLTDTIVDGKVSPPEGVVRYDGDDPYLVVAADKGTATFSDIANGVAQEYGFWLGDAFASGGSAGYDHKAMGITARGAWESVKRHFRALGSDIQAEDHTVVGIGDMSGDVFGNGMLLSRHLKLVGAFDHRHVFLDPDPDPEASHAERERLFALPRSSWADYDATLISEGGGVWPRSAKSVPLHPAAQRALGVEAERLTPTELIRALLRAPVDLLWNGGIGTYVKATAETHADAGDKTNDSVRVDAGELRCRVVGEGGNLGLTQRGRIEFALGGGRVNTDAIDNAGGVNCSDHEVNIKILLDSVVADGDLTRKQRDALLVEMTDAVAGLVLDDNRAQIQALDLALAQAPAMIDVHDRLMRALEHAGRLDRRIEFLPDGDTLAERRGAHLGLTLPELAVLLAYAKITLYADLLGSDLPEDPFLASELARYFPAPLPERFPEPMRAHRLRREIIATHVTNALVDTAGMTFAFRLGEDTGATAADIARAHAAAREVFAMDRLWADVEALDGDLPAAKQLELLLEGRRLVERSTRWLLRHRHAPLDTAAAIEQFAPGAEALAAAVPEILADGERDAWEARVATLGEAGVPEELARRVASLGVLFAALDVVEVASAADRSVDEVAALHFRIGAQLGLHVLRDRIAELPRENRWQTMARAALRDDLFALHAELTADVLEKSPDGGDPDARLEAWRERNATVIERCRSVLDDIRSAGTYDLATLPVALREVRTLIGATAAA